VLEPTQGPAAVVQADAMRKSGPGKRIDLLDVVQELDELDGTRAHLFDLGRLFDRVEIFTHMLDAAA